MKERSSWVYEGPDPRATQSVCLALRGRACCAHGPVDRVVSRNCYRNRLPLGRKRERTEASAGWDNQGCRGRARPPGRSSIAAQGPLERARLELLETTTLDRADTGAVGGGRQMARAAVGGAHGPGVRRLVSTFALFTSFSRRSLSPIRTRKRLYQLGATVRGASEQGETRRSEAKGDETTCDKLSRCPSKGKREARVKRIVGVTRGGEGTRSVGTKDGERERGP